MPDDAALESLHENLRCFDAEILVHTRQLLHPAIEDHEVVQQLDEPIFAAHLEQILVELEARVVVLVLFPLEEHLLLRADCSVTHPLRIIPGKHDLDSGEEPFVEHLLLVGKQLPDAVTDGHITVL